MSVSEKALAHLQQLPQWRQADWIRVSSPTQPHDDTTTVMEARYLGNRFDEACRIVGPAVKVELLATQAEEKRMLPRLTPVASAYVVTESGIFLG